MKHAFMLFLILGFATAALADPQIGQPAPDFTAKDIFGKTVSLKDYKGKIVVLESYAKGCPFCENHYKGGAMQELQRAMLTNGVVWLLINPDATQNTPAKAKQDWLDRKMALTDWIIDTGDSHILKTYAMKTAPQAFVINTNGVLAYQGAMDNLPQLFPGNAMLTADPAKARNYVREAVLALQAGKPVAVPETKPYGCALIYPGMPDEQMFIPPPNKLPRK